MNEPDLTPAEIRRCVGAGLAELERALEGPDVLTREMIALARAANTGLEESARMIAGTVFQHAYTREAARIHEEHGRARLARLNQALLTKAVERLRKGGGDPA